MPVLITFFRMMVQPREAGRVALTLGWPASLGIGLAALLGLDAVTWISHQGSLVLWGYALATGLGPYEPWVTGVWSATQWAGLGMALLAIFAGLLGLGALVAAWGAGDEPLPVSLYRSVRLTFATLPNLLASLASFWLLGSVSRVVGWDFAEAILFFGTWAGVLLFVLNVRRVVRLGRSSPRSRWPATCRGCGYELVGRPTGDACPECGLDYRRAVGADLVRPDWHSGLDRWIAATSLSIVRPGEVGRQLLAYAAGGRSGAYLTRSLLCLAGVGLLSFPLIVAIVAGDELASDSDTVPLLLLGGTGNALLCLTAATVLTLLLGGGLGSIQSILYRRNLLPMAAQAADYLTGAMVLLALGYGFYILVAISIVDRGVPSGPIISTLLALAAGLPAVGMTLLAILHWRIVAAARWNNG